MSKTPYCKVLKLSYHNKKHVKQMKQLLNYCDDTSFQKRGFRCSTNIYPNKDPISPADIAYIAYLDHNKEKTICGYATIAYIKDDKNKIDAINLLIIGTKAFGDRDNYGGVGRKLLNAIIKDAKKDNRIDFIINESFVDQFYFKFGYKQIGTTGTLVKKIKKYPDICRLRFYELSPHLKVRKLFPKWQNKLWYKKSEDNKTRWKKRYGDVHVA